MKIKFRKIIIMVVSFGLLYGCATSDPATADTRKRITLEEATEIAVRELPGEILESEMDNEDGVLAYDFAILKTDGTVFEIEINAYTGSVISIEED